MNSPETATLDSPDVVVVGAGAVGLCCAWYLRAAGLAVTVIDAGEPGGATSWGNCGLIEPSHADPLTQPTALWTALTTAWRRDAPLRIPFPRTVRRGAWLTGFARRCTPRHRLAARAGRFALLVRSRDLLESLLDAASLEVGYARDGLLTLYRDFDNFEAHRAVHEALGVGFRALVGGAQHDLPVRLHADVRAAILTDCDGHLDPVRYGRELARANGQAGVRLLLGRRVTGLLREGDRVIGVEVDGEPLPARRVVLAAGPWTPPLARSVGIDLPIEPARGLSVTWRRPAEGHRHPIYFYERKVVLTPWSDGFRIGSTLEFCGFDERVADHRIAPLLAAPGEYLREPPATPLSEGRQWVGFRPMSLDELPIIGPSSRCRGLLFACGHGQLGISMSTGTGRLIADCVTGARPAVDPRPYLPARFDA